MLDPFKSVNADPFKAGKVAGKRASGKVPEATFDALIFVKEAPDPENKVAVKFAEIEVLPPSSKT